MMKKIIFTLFIFLISIAAYPQYIPQHISYTRIYDFVDELATDGFIDLNSAIKPYSRDLICRKLLEARQQEDKLNGLRQQYASANQQGKEKLAPAILDLEKRILQMNEELDALGVSVRNAEKTKSK